MKKMMKKMPVLAGAFALAFLFSVQTAHAAETRRMPVDPVPKKIQVCQFVGPGGGIIVGGHRIATDLLCRPVSNPMLRYPL